MVKKSTNRVAARTDWERRRDDWLVKLTELTASIRTWAERRRWFVDEHEKTIEEDHIGRYAVPTLFIRAPSGKIVVEPVGCNIIGAQGRVDIESFPSLNRVLLILVDGQWRIETDSRVHWPERWSEQAFVKLVEALTAAA